MCFRDVTEWLFYREGALEVTSKKQGLLVQTVESDEGSSPPKISECPAVSHGGVGGGGCMR